MSCRDLFWTELASQTSENDDKSNSVSIQSTFSLPTSHSSAISVEIPNQCPDTEPRTKNGNSDFILQVHKNLPNLLKRLQNKQTEIQAKINSKNFDASTYEDIVTLEKQITVLECGGKRDEIYLPSIYEVCDGERSILRDLSLYLVTDMQGIRERSKQALRILTQDFDNYNNMKCQSGTVLREALDNLFTLEDTILQEIGEIAKIRDSSCAKLQLMETRFKEEGKLQKKVLLKMRNLSFLIRSKLSESTKKRFSLATTSEIISQRKMESLNNLRQLPSLLTLRRDDIDASNQIFKNGLRDMLIKMREHWKKQLEGNYFYRVHCLHDEFVLQDLTLRKKRHKKTREILGNAEKILRAANNIPEIGEAWRIELRNLVKSE